MASICNISLVRPTSGMRLRTRQARSPSRSAMSVRSEASTTTAAVVFYTDSKGKRQQGTPEEYNALMSSGQIYKASSITGIALGTDQIKTGSPVEEMPLLDTMAFAGPGPELINGRLAMIAFIAAAAAEANTGKSTVEQFTCEPTGVFLLIALLAAGSLVPLVKNVEVTGLGVFTEKKEMINGRAAMLGFASLLVVEGITGNAFFSF